MINKTKNLILLSVLVAVTAVLQTISALLVRFGFFSVSLVMIPIVVSACLLGLKGGMIIGGTFGLTVLIHCITGLDAGGALLFEENWIFTVLATVLRGVAVGALTALIYKITSCIKNNKLRFFITAACAPVFNTGIFVVLFSTLFNTTLHSWTYANGFENALAFIIFGLVGVNFLIEFVSTAVITPPVCSAVSKSSKK